MDIFVVSPPSENIFLKRELHEDNVWREFEKETSSLREVTFPKRWLNLQKQKF